MIRVPQVEKSRPLLLPFCPVVLLYCVMDFDEAGGLLCWQSPLKPHLPQKHVQCEGSHNETQIKGDSGAEGLHAGPGGSLSLSLNWGRCWVRDWDRQHGHTRAQVLGCPLAVWLKAKWQVLVQCHSLFKVWFSRQQHCRQSSSIIPQLLHHNWGHELGKTKADTVLTTA